MFDVDPDRIRLLGAKPLVILLTKLLHAEALAAGLPLAAVSVPLQITVADNGEDGRIEWQNGVETTDWLPSRRNCFQSKAGRMDRGSWKKECWTKSTQRKGAPRKLNGAIGATIAAGGAYIGFTSNALTTDKIDDYVEGIREGIREAGGDPTKLAAIKIYDANAIANWATRHPAVAAWVAAETQGVKVAGFKTIEMWGESDDFASSYVEDTERRFRKGAKTKHDGEGAENKSSAEAAWRWVLDHIAEPRRLVRLTGPSGLGKSRFVFQSLQNSTGLLADIFRSSVIFADYRVVAGSILTTAQQLAEDGKPTLLVVDECPRDAAATLADIATSETSQLRVITIDTDGRPLQGDTVLHIVLEPSDGELVRQIIQQRQADLSLSALERLVEICGGFPRIAVLVASNPGKESLEFATTEDAVRRLLVGAGLTGSEELRAIEVLSMFESVPWEGQEPVALDQVAEVFGRMHPDAMYEHVAKAQSHHLVGRYGSSFAAQPLPLALHLARRRLALLRPATLLRFVTENDDRGLIMSLLARWRLLDNEPVVIDAASRLLGADGPLAEAETILTEFGANMIDVLVHVVPDRVADRLAHELMGLGHERLAAIRPARRSLVEALSKLVFRERSFFQAARLLRRLAAAENEPYGNNATGLFRQLFQVQLSGTEVPPDDRFIVLDEGLEGESEAERKVCLEALSSVFRRDFTRMGNAQQIGTGAPLKDWAPMTWEEVHAFRREGIERLLRLRQKHPHLAGRCEAILIEAVRSMLSADRYKEFSETLVSISEEKGFWPEAVEAVGSWLYFDRGDADSERAVFIRELYDRLFPSEPVDRAIVFTQFWRSNIRDPDARFNRDDRDFGYSERQARALAVQIAEDAEMAVTAVRRMSQLDLKEVFSFAEELGAHCSDRDGLIQVALESLENTGPDTGNMSVLRGLLRGIDSVDPTAADRGARAAIERLDTGRWPLINLHAALAINSDRLARIILDIEQDRLDPAHCAFLSYGRGLDQLEAGDVARLMSALTLKGVAGAWTALEIAVMYRHGEDVPKDHWRAVAGLLADPILLGEGIVDRDRNSHLISDLANGVRHAIGIDHDVAVQWSEQIIRFVRADDSDLFFALDEPMRSMVAMLRADAPETIWAHISRFYETATPIERNRVRRIVGADNDRYEGRSYIGPGPLFGIPEKLILKWADGDEARPSLLLDFYPVLDRASDRSRWHSDLSTLVYRYGGSKIFLDALARRIRPTSWSGSAVPLLEEFLLPLEDWRQHPLREVRTWAKEQTRSLVRRIEREREHEKAWAN